MQLRHIIHDWPDKEALIICQNIAKAMKPSSRLLIRMISLFRTATLYDLIVICR
jgi:hypothetical protein